jgi:hypothetical protein
MDDSSATNALSKLRERRQQIEKRLTELRPLMHEKECLDQAIMALERIGKDQPQTPVWQAALQVLARKGKSLTAAQITDSLLSKGIKIEGKTPVESVRVALRRKPDVITRLKGGRFQIRNKK